MRIVSTHLDLDDAHGSVLIPTMGGFHDGHIALIRAAEAAANGGPVIVSVFVNPAQFEESHDFENYPRTLEDDAQRAAEAGATHVYAPSVPEVYPDGFTVSQTDGSFATGGLPWVVTSPGLEDTTRPGHLPGVYRVVKRLFELTRCAAAVFGEKDWQQLMLARALSEREGLGVRIIPVPTVREPDGIAMSSRNVHLTEPMRERARGLSRCIAEAGRHEDPQAAERAGLAVLESHDVAPEYVAVRDAQTLGDAQQGRPARCLVAGRIDHVRLIDNDAWPGFMLGAGAP